MECEMDITCNVDRAHDKCVCVCVYVFTQPPVQWVPGVLSPGLERGRCVTLTTHPHLVPRSRMSRSYTSSPPKRLHGV
jgi:hypothetical protein